VKSLDSPTYMALAQQIKAGHITSLSQRTPGLPLFLLAMGSETTPRRILFYAQLILHFVSLGMLAWLLSYLGIGRLWIVLLLAAGSLPILSCRPRMPIAKRCAIIQRRTTSPRAMPEVIAHYGDNQIECVRPKLSRMPGWSKTLTRRGSESDPSRSQTPFRSFIPQSKVFIRFKLSGKSC